MERHGGIERPRLQKEIPLMRFLTDLVNTLLATGFHWSHTVLRLGAAVLRLDVWLRLLPAARAA
jgi:hypothetical protein